MQMGVRDLARAETRMETGGKGSQTATDILDNVNAMELAIAETARTDRFDQEAILTIHSRIMAHDTRKQIAGRFRTGQNWIGGNDYNPCGAAFVPPPPEEVPGLICFRRSFRRPWCMPSSRQFIHSMTAMVARVVHSSTWC